MKEGEVRQATIAATAQVLMDVLDMGAVEAMILAVMIDLEIRETINGFGPQLVREAAEWLAEHPEEER